MCKNSQNAAVIADIFMKFGTKVLNWTLNDSKNFYYKQTLDREIIKFFRRGPVFFCAPCIFVHIMYKSYCCYTRTIASLIASYCSIQLLTNNQYLMYIILHIGSSIKHFILLNKSNEAICIIYTRIADSSSVNRINDVQRCAE